MTRRASTAAADAGQRSARDDAAIRLRGLSKRFPPDTVALRDIDLTIAAGEFFTLLGPSGCGKTTLLRLIAGLDTVTEGDVAIGGVSVTDVPAHKRNVNTVFQSYALFDHLNVADNIGFGLKMRRVHKADIKKRVAETADFIRIGELLDRRVEQLSGGQRQRVALARALINEPDVLLLDEPLSALDAGLRGQLQLELLRIQRRLGMTFIFVTHDQQEAMVMSDRIAVLDDGLIRQIGPPQRIYEYPDNLFVARFMGHHNLFEIRSHDLSYLELAFGRLAGEFEHGSHVLIRPEAIHVSEITHAASAPNVFTATVAERLYRGHVIEYTIAIGETRIVASVNNLGQFLFEAGSEIAMTIDISGVVTFDG